MSVKRAPIFNRRQPSQDRARASTTACPTNLERLVYCSEVVDGLDRRSVLQSILATARRKNPRNRLTGALAMTAAMFAQTIEGPSLELQKTFAEIEQDRRHHNVHVLSWRPVTARLFGGFSMAGTQSGEQMRELEALLDGPRTSPAYVTALLARIVSDPRTGWMI